MPKQPVNNAGDLLRKLGKDKDAKIEQLTKAICIAVREEFTEAEVDSDAQAIEWFLETFDDKCY